jgi:hypothetical protein
MPEAQFPRRTLLGISAYSGDRSLQHLAVRLPHHVSWVHNGCSEDPRAGNGGRHERAGSKSEAAWCNVIASRCRVGASQFGGAQNRSEPL